MKELSRLFMIATSALLCTSSSVARSQSLPYIDTSPTASVMGSTQLQPVYLAPTERTKVVNYLFDAYGPYPLAGAGVVAGINQWSNSPPEWHQGTAGYARRFGSVYGIAAVSTTTRYAFSEALREDTLYYRCECTGAIARFNHAVISTVTARRGFDGHRVFSISGLIAPYVGTTTAVYLWYPDRFGAKDAFRLGNYNLLASVGGNIALEFLYSGPHSLLSRMHLNNAHGSPEPGPNH